MKGECCYTTTTEPCFELVILFRVMSEETLSSLFIHVHSYLVGKIPPQSRLNQARMNLNRRCVWILAILIGSFFGYLVFKSRYKLVSYSPKLQASQNHGGAKTANATERALTESVATNA